MRNSHIIKTFLQGLLFALPILLTVALITWLVTSAESLLAQPLKAITPHQLHFPGMGILAALVVIYMLGLAIRGRILNFLFNPLIKALNGLPIVSVVYKNIKEMIDFVSGAKDDELEKVVLVSLPNNVRIMGFVTNNNSDVVSGSDEKILSVYLPMSYQMGGYLVYVPESEVETLDISKEQAMQRILTAEISGSRSAQEK